MKAISPTPSGVRSAASSPGTSSETRRELAACYRMFARRGMDDLIYTHLSARLPDTPDRFLFIPFGMLFEEVTASNLLEVDLAGNDASGSGTAVNPAGCAS